MNILHPFACLPLCNAIASTKPFPHNNQIMKFSLVFLQSASYPRTWTPLCCSRGGFTNLNGEDFNIDLIKEDLADDDGSSETLAQETYGRRKTNDIDLEGLKEDNDVGGYYGQGPFTGRPEKDHERDPEVADILGSLLDDPQKAQSKMEDRIRKKRNKILHTKTGSGVPMKVSVNKFDFSNSYIWLEFYNTPLEKDISLICDTIRSWHIVGRLGGCNSMNMQLSQSPITKRPSYDFIQGANVTPTTFYNIGDLEVQDNLARIWVDIGTSEPLLLDVLINALTQISSDFVGIKQVVFGGEEYENWNENMTSEDSGFSVHKI
ncbi:hypothetical protein HN51_041974 [Arachis hypogaea]|uniref:uncharacterized protein n=1 Tax=Arachis hypogaea TaxID=3818 RepID=UPI000DED0DDC|nr:uncharacterized protein LOC112697482 isoform X1 [Arachis hypogaea]QHN87830.1 uncharacterized protein DS421_16g558470 [Arachis hypogaea]QHN87831.1 uncharacterized protein DS421_16g558470 [Arachis hypogaea]